MLFCTPAVHVAIMVAIVDISMNETAAHQHFSLSLNGIFANFFYEKLRYLCYMLCCGFLFSWYCYIFAGTSTVFINRFQLHICDISVPQFRWRRYRKKREYFSAYIFCPFVKCIVRSFNSWTSSLCECLIRVDFVLCCGFLSVYYIIYTIYRTKIIRRK